MLEGNSANDWMDAGTGSNELYGNSGNDTLIGMEGDVFVGGSGRNEIIANAPAPEPEPQGSIRIEYVDIYEGYCRFDLIAENLPDGPLWVEWTQNTVPPRAETSPYATYGNNGYFIQSVVYSPEAHANAPDAFPTEFWVRISDDAGFELERTITYDEHCAPFVS